MIREERKTIRDFKRRIWCGSKIREDKEHDSTGVWSEMLLLNSRQSLTFSKRTGYGEFVSDR